MVPQSSPIASESRLFYNTLFDENASCHLALGRAYRFSCEMAAGFPLWNSPLLEGIRAISTWIS